MMRAESIRVMHPLFQADQGGSIPTSALQLRIDRIDTDQACALNRLWHSRLPEIRDPRSILEGGIHFGASFEDFIFAVAIWTHPVARALPQVEWLELRRLAIANDAPKNTASRMLKIMAMLIRRQRPEIKRLISYQDSEHHSGSIYAAAGWTKVILKSRPKPTWDRPGRRRPVPQSDAMKHRWEKIVSTAVKWVELNPPEKSRTYVFAGGDKVAFENVVRVEVRDSGKHRIETASGRKAFVSPGWLWMEIDTPEWTF